MYLFELPNNKFIAFNMVEGYNRALKTNLPTNLKHRVIDSINRDLANLETKASEDLKTLRDSGLRNFDNKELDKEIKQYQTSLSSIIPSAVKEHFPEAKEFKINGNYFDSIGNAPVGEFF